MKNLTLKKKQAISGWLFLLPVIIGLLFFFIKPIIQSIAFSFSTLSFADGGYSLKNSGIKNYHDILFEHPNFIENLYTSILTMIAQVPLVVIFSFFVANIVNQKFRGRMIVRVILFLPVILSASSLQSFEANNVYQNYMTIAGTGALKETFAVSNGIFSSDLGTMLQNIGIMKGAVGYITGAVDKIYEVISLSGIQILIFLAALQAIPSSLYEAAEMEGATSWESFWKITFPMVIPMILVCTVYSIIDNFTQYKNKVMSLINITAFNEFNFGQSAAMSWIYCLISLLFILIVFLFFSGMIRKTER